MQRSSLIGACLASIAACACSARSFAACRLREMAELPVTMIGNQAVVVARIDGADVPVVLDTGAGFDMLSYGAAAKLHLAAHRLGGHPVLGGVGGEAPAVLTYAIANVRLGRARIDGAKFILSGLTVGPAAGFLGRDILDGFDLDFDLPGRLIKLMRPRGCRSVAPVYWARSRPYSAAQVAQGASAPIIIGSVDGEQIRVMLDTGASSTILDVRAAAGAGVSRSSAGAVAGGVIHGVAGRPVRTWVVPIATLVIGGEEVRNTRLRIGDLSLLQVDMVLGSDFLLSHHVYLANSQQKVYFTYEGGPVFER
jgi:predicted aspartyl protease